MLSRLRLFCARFRLAHGDRALLATLPLLAVQLFISIEAFDSYHLRLLEDGWARLAAGRGTFFRLLLLGGALFLFFTRTRLSAHFQSFRSTTTGYARTRAILVQILSFCVAIVLAVPVFTTPFPWTGWEWPVTLAWFTAMVAAMGFALIALAPATFWRQLVREERNAFVGSVVIVGACALVWRYGLASAEDMLWSTELATMTLNASHALLSLGFTEVELDPDRANLGVHAFRVHIAPECSGIEGMALLLTIVFVYLYTFRKDLRFPRALILPVLAVPLSLSLNVVRIAALVSIGATLSPRLALQGFHIYGGVVLLVIECALLWQLSQGAWLAKASRPAGGFQLDAEAALLIPLLALLATMLITGLLTADFDWLYPLRIVVVAAALWICREPLVALVRSPRWGSLLVGIAVFPLWLWLVPPSLEVDRAFAGHLDGVPRGIAAAWIALRVTGAVILVPIAEELAFRGYAIHLLTRDGRAAPAPPLESPPFQWPAFVLSSVAFGALHGQWIAGTVAGMAYGMVRYRSGRLVDAVVAHATTNALLSAYVLATGRWSYW